MLISQIIRIVHHKVLKHKQWLLPCLTYWQYCHWSKQLGLTLLLVVLLDSLIYQYHRSWSLPSPSISIAAPPLHAPADCRVIPVVIIHALPSETDAWQTINRLLDRQHIHLITWRTLPASFQPIQHGQSAQRWQLGFISPYPSLMAFLRELLFVSALPLTVEKIILHHTSRGLNVELILQWYTLANPSTPDCQVIHTSKRSSTP